jgi:predicted ATPase
MAQHPFLKSIRPVNLLSFGPNTEEIELRPLNILIGPNGSGKSNLIEIIGLLSKLPDKDPWSDVIATGGADEWVWKGQSDYEPPSITITTVSDEVNVGAALGGLYGVGVEPVKSIFYSISLWDTGGSFGVAEERFTELQEGEDGKTVNSNAFDRSNWEHERENSYLHTGLLKSIISDPTPQKLIFERSVLSQLGHVTEIASKWPRMYELANDFERIICYRDWIFGKKSKSRQLQRVGLDSYHLAADSSNVAQVLKAMRDRGNAATFDSLIERMKSFYEPVKDVDTELVGTHLRIMIKEEGLSSRTPAERLSDGTLRWLNLLIVLLDPTPLPLVCIEEPELGLHPDMIPTLADLLRDASTRTQLIVTTHSTALVDAFSDDPESVCVCEKVDGSTVIRRLDRERLNVWLKDYSLGHLWASGEIGGNRW